MKTRIVVKTSFEGLHQYVDAPEEVSFLRQPHRHMFDVEVEMDVFHDDRELEFIIVKRALNDFLQNKSFDIQSSCEQMCEAIIEFLIDRFGERQMIVSVYEDGENGGKVYYEFEWVSTIR